MDRTSDIPVNLYDVASYAGHDWYVIGIDGREVTLLAKDDEFGHCPFDLDEEGHWRTGYYRTSDIQEYLEETILAELMSNGAEPVVTDFFDIGCFGKICLLSIREAEQLPSYIRKFGSPWWLRNQGCGNDLACTVTKGSDVNDFGTEVHREDIAVRPVITVIVDSLLK